VEKNVRSRTFGTWTFCFGAAAILFPLLAVATLFGKVGLIQKYNQTTKTRDRRVDTHGRVELGFWFFFFFFVIAFRNKPIGTRPHVFYSSFAPAEAHLSLR
jgi:hypothetical protein